MVNLGYGREFTTSILDFCNPFGLVDTDGGSLNKIDRTEWYVFIFEKIYSLFPRGYVDIVLLLCHLYPKARPFKIAAMKSEFRNFGIKDDEILIKFWNDKDYMNSFEKIIQGLHSIAGTHFDNSCYLQAIQYFRMNIENWETNRKNKDEDT